MALAVFWFLADSEIGVLKVRVSAIRYAREKQIPFFGICLGMQVSVIEYARSIVGLNGANSSEINPATEYPCD